MPNRPLLLFPVPEAASRARKSGGPGSVHFPSIERQGQRLSPLFARLQKAFNARRVEIQQSMAGVEPEQALVIETIGSVENFANAVKKIAGLEWMGEIETEQIEPDTDFYDKKNPAKRLNGRLYLVMSDLRALQEMLSLWHQYQRDQKMQFNRGLAPFRNVFLCLKDIRRWDHRDRIEDTGVLDTWREGLQYDSNGKIRFEIELWFRKSAEKQRAARMQIEKLIGVQGGEMLGSCSINNIAYHALLATIPASAAKEIIKHPPEVDLIKCDDVMFFRPVGQMVTRNPPRQDDWLDHEMEESGSVSGDPVVAILDGMPLANHTQLKGRLTVEDPDDYASVYSARDRVHGTAMASLVVHGDLSDQEQPLSRLVYMRPIMKPVANSWRVPHVEQIPEDVLVVDLIHRAVRRLFEKEKDEPATASSVRIINLSIGDPCRPFLCALSPLAKLLDWLSVKYAVLFIISAGNHTKDIDISMPKRDFYAMETPAKEAEVVRAIYKDVRGRKILSPRESINGITVGALHFDAATKPSDMGAMVDLFEKLLPSSVSAFGGGYRRSIKPDLLFNGGRILHTEKIAGNTDRTTFESCTEQNILGNQTASPGNGPTDTGNVVYSCGTSNATALISRMAAICYDTLRDIFKAQRPEADFDSYAVPLLKAMVVHSCSWRETGERLQEVLKTSNNGQGVKTRISQWLGYGAPDSNRVLMCTEQRVTLLGFGKLSDGEAHIFKLPLPASMGSRRERRRLGVTMAWLSPVAVSTQRY